MKDYGNADATLHRAMSAAQRHFGHLTSLAPSGKRRHRSSTARPFVSEGPSAAAGARRAMTWPRPQRVAGAVTPPTKVARAMSLPSLPPAASHRSRATAAKASNLQHELSVRRDPVRIVSRSVLAPRWPTLATVPKLPDRLPQVAGSAPALHLQSRLSPSIGLVQNVSRLATNRAAAAPVRGAAREIPAASVSPTPSAAATARPPSVTEMSVPPLSTEIGLERWLTDRLAQVASRPQRGATGFDPKLTPAWPGTLQGPAGWGG